jgi:hypothetical protein
MNQSIVKVALLFSVLVGTIADPAKSTLANATYLNERCQQNQKLRPIERFTVFYKSEFKTNGQKYWLSSARFQDGAAIVCLSKENFSQPRLLTELKPLQSQFIRKIVKAPGSNTAFLVTVAKGNGFRNVPITEYRLDLFNPAKPKLTQIRTWTE